jgi:protein ImuB
VLLCIDLSGEIPEPEQWEELLDALDAVSPLIDDVRSGLAYLDMHGSPGGASAWMTQTRTLLSAYGRVARLGVGLNKIAARAAAHVADGRLCRPGSEAELLAELPLALLDIEPEMIERLTLLGIERLGDLAALPHGPFVRRFGSAAARWHELAKGVDRRPFLPRTRTVAIEASIFGEGRAVDEAQVFFALRMLLTRVCSDLERCGKRAGALHLSLELEDAGTVSYDVPLAMPTAAERTMFEMLRAKLEGATFEAPVVGLRIQARILEEGGEAQALLRAVDFDPAKVAVTIARLEAILGESVTRATMRQAHLLEERFAYEPFSLDKRKVTPLQTESDRGSAEVSRTAVPQLRLLEVREIPVELRAGEPAIVDRQAVTQCAGPWRIQERPFVPAPITRDEYDVVLADGTFARIYHQGAHWYLRGVYE